MISLFQTSPSTSTFSLIFIRNLILSLLRNSFFIGYNYQSLSLCFFLPTLFPSTVSDSTTLPHCTQSGFDTMRSSCCVLHNILNIYIYPVYISLMIVSHFVPTTHFNQSNHISLQTQPGFGSRKGYKIKRSPKLCSNFEGDIPLQNN